MKKRKVKRIIGRYELADRFQSDLDLEFRVAQLFRAYVASRIGLSKPLPDQVCLKIWQASVLALRNEHLWLVERERFRREGAILMAMDCPHVLTCFESGSGKLEGKEVEFHALELCVSDLAEFVRTRIESGNPLQPEEILHVCQEMAIGIDYFHQRGIIHRDIRPENTLLRSNGKFCIADPGVALEANGDPTRRVGTATYAAPEHSPTRSGPGLACPQSDVYALAKVALMMMTGEAPRAITARQILELPSRFQSEPWADPVCEVLASATCERVSRRHSTALALVDDLRRAFDVSVPRIAPDARAQAPLHHLSHRPVAILAVLAAVFLLIIASAFMRPKIPVEVPARPCRTGIIDVRLRALAGANLRTGPSLDSPLLCPVPTGSHMTFRGNVINNWIQVCLPDAPGVEPHNTSGATNSCLGKEGFVYAANVVLECH